MQSNIGLSFPIPCHHKLIGTLNLSGLCHRLIARWGNWLDWAGPYQIPIYWFVPLFSERRSSLPVLTIPAAQQMLGVSYPTARNQVDKLLSASILSPVDETSCGRLYAAGEILKILQ